MKKEDAGTVPEVAAKRVHDAPRDVRDSASHVVGRSAASPRDAARRSR